MDQSPYLPGLGLEQTDVLPEAWAKLLPAGIAEAPLQEIAKRRAGGDEIFPPAGQVFHALQLTPPEAVRAVLLGQDPYHEPGQAMGLAFAVPPTCAKLPPSLKNILKEYQDDLGIEPPDHPDLTQWARQGVLLLNTTLTVQAHQAFSHAKLGWQAVTDAIIRAVSRFEHPVVFLLWGAPAQAKRPLIDETRHGVLAAAHPSPLSAFRGFFGSHPFSQANRWLTGHGQSPVDWQC